MNWVSLQNKESSNFSPSPQSQLPYYLPPPPPNFDSSDGGFDLSNKISPSVLLIIIILAIIFFVSGLLHLLVRFLLKPPTRDPDDLDNVTSLQGQLQQLFHLHDAGVDQSFIDTLPVFSYKAIIGLKNPFDCAVCLCEFEPEDKLRLLPNCSHAFHMECIDTWLLSHSNCPLCRGSLLPDFSPNNSCCPIVLALESGSESSRQIVTDRENNVIGRTSSVLATNSLLDFHGDDELGSSRLEISHKSCEILTKDESLPTIMVDSGEKVVPVKLGKYRNVDMGEGSSNSNVDERRCYSMGSFEYVMSENSSLQVAIRTLMKKQPNKKPTLPLTPGHRPAMSVCDCESKREFNVFEGIKRVETNGIARNIVTSSNANSISRSKKESFSISKIWLRGEKEKQKSSEHSSRRAFSFRFPMIRNVSAAAGDDDLKVKNGNCYESRTNSEIEIGRWENGDDENQNFNSKTPSFARRTLLWLVGKQNKVVHSSFTPNV